MVLLPLSTYTFAQDSEDEAENAEVEEVVTTGIRSSLIDAIAIKRDNVGVMEAITAEDFGKFPDGNLASREVAAYLVSKHGGFDCVPTTVLRDGPFGVGAVQEWINVSEDIDAISLGQSENPAIRNIAFFDVVININTHFMWCFSFS